MCHATSSPYARQAEQLRRQLNQAPALPFSQLLDADTIQQALADEALSFRDRLFSPVVTLWLSLPKIASVQ